MECKLLTQWLVIMPKGGLSVPIELDIITTLLCTKLCFSNLAFIALLSFCHQSSNTFRLIL